MTATRSTVWESAMPFDKVIVDSSRLDRLQQDWSAVAKEGILLTFRGGTFFAMGSELACLRLAYHYRMQPPKTCRAEFSRSCQEWVFALDTDL